MSEDKIRPQPGKDVKRVRKVTLTEADGVMKSKFGSIRVLQLRDGRQTIACQRQKAEQKELSIKLVMLAE